MIPPSVWLALALIILGASGCATIEQQSWWPFPPYQPPVPTYALTVTKAGSGLIYGTVTAPPGINCGSTCSGGYSNGTVVTLTASSVPPGSFSAWSGACTGSASTCTVTMSTAKSVTATFLAGDTIPPPATGQPTIGTPTSGSTTASFPVTWPTSIDQPSNTAVPRYDWTAGYNDGSYSNAGSLTTTSLTLAMPYHSTGSSQSGYFCVTAVDAVGLTSGASCNTVTVPANPSQTGQLTAFWVGPTTNTDGSPLTDLASYRVYYTAGSTNPCRAPTSLSVPAAATSAVITGLVTGNTYSAAVSAINAAGTEGACSPQASAAAHTTTLACPTGQFLAEYFNNKTLTPPAVTTRCETYPINNNYGSGGPGVTGIGVDNFSVRWTGTFTFTGTSTTFTATTDDGMRVYYDGAAVINQWFDQASTTYTQTIATTAGTHQVKVEYYESIGGAVAQASWATSGGGAMTLHLGPEELITTSVPFFNPFFGVGFVDGSFATLKQDANTMCFYHGLGNLFWKYCGPLSNPFQTLQTGWPKTLDQMFKKPDGSPWPYHDTTLGYPWLYNIYKIDATHLLGFVQHEHCVGCAHVSGQPTTEYGHRLAYSSDAGETWTLLPEFLRPQNVYGNSAGMQYLIVTDGGVPYFYSYYNEYPCLTVCPDPNGDTSGIGVARAKVADVLAAAPSFTNVTWVKYSGGGVWATDAFTGLGANVMPPGPVTAANFNGLGDSAYSAPLGKYLFMGSRPYIYVSTDGVTWPESDVIPVPAAARVAFPTFASLDSAANDDAYSVGANFVLFYTGNPSATDYWRRVITIGP